jgi:hypothetical protein
LNAGLEVSFEEAAGPLAGKFYSRSAVMGHEADDEHGGMTADALGRLVMLCFS